MRDNEVTAYYGCPEQYGSCEVDNLGSSNIGYFRFGEDLICYGKSPNGSASDTPARIRFDAASAVKAAERTVILPFSPSDVAANLRLERYVENTSQVGWRAHWKSAQRGVYYLIRPLLGVSVRKHLQRRALRDWNQIKFPAWPVDCTVDRLFKRILAISMTARNIDSVPFIWFWPDGMESCVIMTHDVEEAAGVALCDTLMDINSAAGIRSSFQFVPEHRYTVSSEFLNHVRARGFEVNIHDLNHDGHLYDNREEFLRRAERINHYLNEYRARGFRSAVLYRNLNWYDAFHFDYDMSVPNVAHLDPQRGGCCTITPYFVGNIIELPLTTTQDYSLFNILSDYSIELWKKQVDFIVRNHGLVSFNVHPDYVADNRARKTYEALLAYLGMVQSNVRIWFPLPNEVAHWWRERSKMRLIYASNQWRIEGPGAERARIAYARKDGDNVCYSFT